MRMALHTGFSTHRRIPCPHWEVIYKPGFRV